MTKFEPNLSPYNQLRKSSLPQRWPPHKFKASQIFPQSKTSMHSRKTIHQTVTFPQSQAKHPKVHLLKLKMSVPRTTSNKDCDVECGHCEGKHGSFRKSHCPVYGKIWSRCGKQNHFVSKCKSYGKKSHPGANVREFEIEMLCVYTSSLSSEK